LVWILVGLLFNSTGLYVGFDNAFSFVYMIVGMFCFAFGVALFALRLRERPRTSEKTRLSPNFISAGDTQVYVVPNNDNSQDTAQANPE
jgi:hypothetical protein